MRFRLTYNGELKARQKDPDTNEWDRMAPHVQSIRKVFHRQLRHLWATNRFLSSHTVGDLDYGHQRLIEIIGWWTDGDTGENKRPLQEAIADIYRENGYRFVPLVREDWALSCSLEILFLRRDAPGSLVSAGDLDNRIKTLIDALRKPNNGNELRGNEEPSEGEDPFFCLLEDDKLITGLSVETDILLQEASGNNDEDRRQVNIVITVDIKPYVVTLFNQNLA